MQVNNNLNSMVQLEKKLEKSADALAKLSLENGHAEQKEPNQLNKNIPQKDAQEEEQERDLVKEMVKQIEIPIAYTANAEVISTQNSIYQTIIDIKA